MSCMYDDVHQAVSKGTIHRAKFSFVWSQNQLALTYFLLLRLLQILYTASSRSCQTAA